MKLTNKQIDQIKAAETANILKKIKAGKTLSANERSQIESLREVESPKTERKLPDIKQWYPSMSSLEGATGIPRSMQQAAKDDGCEAFHASGRVNVGALIRWIFKKGVHSETIDWGDLNEELDAKLKQVKLDTLVRELISLEEAQQCIQDLMTVCMGAVKRVVIEFPKTLEMRSAAEIKIQCDEIYRDTLRRATAEIEQLKGKK